MAQKSKNKIKRVAMTLLLLPENDNYNKLELCNSIKYRQYLFCMPTTFLQFFITIDAFKLIF